MEKEFTNNLHIDLNKFDEKREKGENNSIIRNDNAEEFISYVNKNNIKLAGKIEKSVFETNSFLIDKKEVKLIEYSAFFGSIQIFRYLIMNNVDINSSIWLYAIH